MPIVEDAKPSAEPGSTSKHTGDEPGRIAPLLIDLFLGGGAIGTLCCNLSYLAGWSLQTASLLFATISLVAGSVIFACRRLLEKPMQEPSESGHFLEFRRDVIPAAIAFVCLLIWSIFWHGYLSYWLLTIPLLAVGYVIARPRQRRQFRDVAGSHSGKSLLLLLSAGALLVTLVTNRPNADDCYYLNRAAALADGFHQTMRTGYTLFEKTGLPFPYPSFPLIAFHDWIGFWSWATGLQPMAVSAYVVAPIGAVLVVLAYSILCRMLFPEHWKWALAGVFAMLVLGGPTMWHFANFGFSRIWQGKSLVLHVILPVTAAYGLRFGGTGRRGDWLRLAAAATCATGLSSISIWLLPAFTVLAVLGGNTRWRDLLPRTTAAVVACAYPLAEGVMAHAGAVEGLGYRVDDRPFDWILQLYFGGKLGVLVWATVILLAPLLALPLRARRYLLVGVLGALLTLLNPMLFEADKKYVTSGVVFWRILWLLPPLPVLAAALLLVGFHFSKPKTRALAGPAIWCLLTGLFVGLALQRPADMGFEPAQIGWPGLKVHQPEYAVIELLMNKLPPGAPVMAPEAVGWMIPTFRHRLGAIAPRMQPVSQTIEHQMKDGEDAELRYQSLRFAEGTEPVDPAALRRLVERFSLRAVVMCGGLPGFATANTTLAGMGFVPLPCDQYAVWIRP